MNDGQVKQIVDAIRAHARAMVAGRLWAQAEAGTDVNHVVADADTLLAALSASSGGEHGGAGIPGGGKPEHAAGPGDELTATPPLSADLVTARARIADLEEAARRYFNADGSVSFLVSAEAVVEARKAAARRIAELEAQVRERDEALKVAAKALDAIANEPLGPMDASDREVLRACEAVALNALANPLIGGAK